MTPKIGREKDIDSLLMLLRVERTGGRKPALDEERYIEPDMQTDSNI